MVDHTASVGVAQAGRDSGCLVNTTISHRKVPVSKSVSMCETGSHYFILRDPAKPKKLIFKPFRCKSWRHGGSCQRFRGAQDFVRVSDGILSRGDRWVYLVLTFARPVGFTAWDAYLDGVRRWQKLNQRLGRRFGPIEYVQTWEKHQKGFPHVNVVIHNRAIWESCQGDGWRSWRQELIPHLLETGFGRVVHVEPLRPDTGAGLAGYLTKLSRELTGAGPKNQTPIDAPPNFRRLRASQGLLPPIFRPGKYEAIMLPTVALGKTDLLETFDKVISLRLAEARKKAGVL